MNPASWDSLPADIQKIFNDLDPWLFQRRIDILIETQNEYIEKAKQAEQTFYTLSDSERALWLDAAKPTHETWIETTEARGEPARAVYNELMRLIAKYKSQ